VTASGVDAFRWEAPSGALRDYEMLWTPTSDAPRVYHIPCGLVVIATAVENRIYLPFGGDRIYPNLWALILGPSSFFRKTTCISKARKTIGKIYQPHEGDTAAAGPLLPDEFSREALLRRLSERGQGLLTYSEFSGALAAFGRDYMSGTRETLSDLYDAPESYTRLVGEKTFTIKQPCLSILAASQTDWFLEKVKGGDIRGGFLARFSFWPAFNKNRFLAVPPPPDQQLANALVKQLNDIRKLKGAIEIPPAVQGQYAKWLERHEQSLQGQERAADLSPFWSRLSIMTLKIATLLQVSHNQQLCLTADSMERAIALTEFLKGSLRQLFAEEFAFSKDMQDRQRVLRAIQKRPDGVARRDLMRASSLLMRQFDGIIDTLIAEGRVVHRDKLYFPEDAAAAYANSRYECPRCGESHQGNPREGCKSVTSGLVSRGSTDANPSAFPRAN
jgi:hypothetical protein